MTSDIVGIHGMAQHQSGRRQLLRRWADALGDGLEAALGAPPERLPTVDLAFYGSVYLDEVDRDAPVLMGDGPEAEVFAEMSDEEADDILGTARELFGEAELAEAAAGVDMGISAVPRSLAAVLRVLDRRFGRANAVLHIGVLRQVRRYLADAGTQQRVDPVVVRTASGCRALIAHSLGSVVGYRYLTANRDHGVDLFLTLGSPLGLRMVRERIPVTVLDVPRWVDIRDPRDPVACAGDLRQWWPQVESGEVGNGLQAHAVERYLGKALTGSALIKTFPELAA